MRGFSRYITTRFTTATTVLSTHRTRTRKPRYKSSQVCSGVEVDVHSTSATSIISSQALTYFQAQPAVKNWLIRSSKTPRIGVQSQFLTTVIPDAPQCFSSYSRTIIIIYYSVSHRHRINSGVAFLNVRVLRELRRLFEYFFSLLCRTRHTQRSGFVQT